MGLLQRSLQLQLQRSLLRQLQRQLHLLRLLLRLLLQCCCRDCGLVSDELGLCRVVREVLQASWSEGGATLA